MVALSYPDVDLRRDPFDLLCDIVIADELRTGLIPEPPGADTEAWEMRRETWTDEHVVIGASDGGAHLDMLTTFDYPVRYLALTQENPGLSLTRNDLPAEAGRLHAEPTGMADVIVNGTEIVRDGRLLDSRPGWVLRGGRDTVDMPGRGGTAAAAAAGA